MRTFRRPLLALGLALLCGHAASAQSSQNNETLSAGVGGTYDTSVCNDPKIAVNAAAQNATPYHDATPTGQPDPLLAALSYLGQKDGLPYLNRASVCLHASGVVFMVPNNLVDQVTTLVGEIEASDPGGDVYNASANNTPSGQLGGSGAVGSGTTVDGGPPANGGTVANGGTTTSGTPCEPNYDMSTAAGQAAAMQNAAQTQYACCLYRRAHNPELAPCTPPPPPTGEKTVKRESGPARPSPAPLTPSGPPNLLAIQKAMNDCLSARLPYWVASNVQSQYMQMARNSASASVRSAPPESLPYQTQVFIVETAMALQAQAFHDRKYGQGEYDPTDARDSVNPAYAPSYLAGWFDRCLATSGLQPIADHRTAYAKFLGAGVMDSRILAFGSGYVYGDVLAPVTMLPPYVPAAP